MINLGKYNTLKVLEESTQGYCLKGDDRWGEILLPYAHTKEKLSAGDDVEVFVYLDSEDVVIATTEKPLATVGEFAVLKVAAVEEVGVFLNWGLDKDLFLPRREQSYRISVGDTCIVYIYVDSSDRIAASTRLTKYIEKSRPPYAVGEAVELLLCQVTDLGFKAIINGTHYGMIFHDDVINHREVGQKVSGYIKNIRPDGKVDLSIRKLDHGNRNELADKILQKLNEADSYMEFNAKTSAEDVNAMFGVSRKRFKVALGYLYRQKLVVTDDNGTRLVK